MITSESLLLNGQAHHVPGTIPASGHPIIGPRLQAGRSAKEIVWQVAVEQCLGAPSSASLSFGIQMGFRTTRGNQTPPAGVGGGVGGLDLNMTDVAQKWFTLEESTDAGFLPDGAFPASIADRTVSSGALASAVAVGDLTVTATAQYAVGATLNIDAEAFSVTGAPTKSGAGWVHPVISHGSPNSNSSSGTAATAHAAGTVIHAPRTYRKRVLGGFDQRFVMIPTYSGGTSPHFIVTVQVLARY